MSDQPSVWDELFAELREIKTQQAKILTLLETEQKKQRDQIATASRPIPVDPFLADI